MKLPREFYIPKNATKVAHKASDAVAYVYANEKGQPCARVFYGKQTKPLWSYRFRSEAERAKSISEAFEARKARQEAMKARKADEKAWRHGFEPGDIFRSSWGYDQTNVDYYEVISVTEKMLTVCQIASASSSEEGFMTARCVPAPGEFKGKPFKVLAQAGSGKSGPKDGYFKVASYANAYYLPPVENVAGVKVYPASSYSWYA